MVNQEKAKPQLNEAAIPVALTTSTRQFGKFGTSTHPKKHEILSRVSYFQTGSKACTAQNLVVDRKFLTFC